MADQSSANYNLLKETLDAALTEYTRKENMSLIKEAKSFYFHQTGKVHEDDDDFESRMTGFNEWFLLQFVPENGTRTLIEEYCEQQNVSEDLRKALTENVCHSLFEYTGQNLRKNPQLRDLIHSGKISLSKTYPLPSLVKGDIFTGRIIQFRDENFLLEGIGTLPMDVKTILKKQGKKVGKLRDRLEEERFLLKVEALKSKWKQYVHVDIQKIFQFD